MTTTAVSHVTTYFSPSTQLDQCFNTLKAMLNSLCEKTEQAFNHVILMKRGSDGNIKFYPVKDPVTGNEIGKTEILTYIEDAKTHELYLNESAMDIRIKCALVAMGMPFYTLGIMGCFICKTPIEITSIACKALLQLSKQLLHGQCSVGFAEFRQRCHTCLESAKHGLFEVVKAPIFGFSAELAGLYGIFKPYHGKKFESQIEHAWQQGASYKEDFRKIPSHDEDDCWKCFIKDIQESRPFYAAYCFQVRGSTDASRIVLIRRTPIQ